MRKSEFIDVRDYKDEFEKKLAEMQKQLEDMKQELARLQRLSGESGILVENCGEAEHAVSE